MRLRAALLAAVLLIAMTAGCSGTNKANQASTSPPAPSSGAPESVTPEQARAIAKEAYIYGFPMVDSYRIQYAYFVDSHNPQYKGALEPDPQHRPGLHPGRHVGADAELRHARTRCVGADLRTEPLVLTVPAIDQDRYYSLQFIDGYTYNFAYVGSRTTGNSGGKYLLAGPGWKGEKPEGISQVISSDTELALVVYRTQLFGAQDMENVKKIQAGYTVQPLSAFLDQPAPAPAPPIDFFPPLTADQEKTSPQFFDILNFVLRFAPTLPSEKDLRARFATIGVGPDGSFDADKLTPEMRAAVEGGMADAWAELNALKKDKVDTGQVASGDMFGTKEELNGNYLYRMAGAVFGIFGNSKQEAMYPSLTTDSTGEPLTGANNYTLTFAPGQLPPVNAFWSVTMYKLPESLLVDNPINRYLINSPMLPGLAKNPDGSVTIYVQNQSPGAEQEANWLPAPPGPFTVAMRLYWPKPDALNGTWQAPKLVKA